EGGASSSPSDEDDGRGTRVVQTMVGEGMMFKEDTFLTSANLCRWIIDFAEIQVGKQVGLGSYGVVYRGKWKGFDVAITRFIKQKLDERRMLEFRAEMAFLSELHHPNIVLFIGTFDSICCASSIWLTKRMLMDVRCLREEAQPVHRDRVHEAGQSQGHPLQ